MLKLIKPGASEFKRSEHIILVYKRVLRAVDIMNERNLSFDELEIDRKNNGRKLFNIYFETEVLKREPNFEKWDDRITGLFIREGLIKKENGRLVYDSLGKFISSSDNFDFTPFSNADFIQLVSSSIYNEEINDGFVQRALKLLEGKKLHHDSFYLSFFIENVNKEKEKINKKLSKNSSQTIKELLLPDSGFPRNKSQEKKDSLNNFTSLISKYFLDVYENKNNISNVIKDIIEFDGWIDAIKNWKNYMITSIKFLLYEKYKTKLKNNEIKKQIKNKTLPISNSDISEILLYFYVAKKYGDYKYLTNKYILSLPIFKIEDDLISIEPKLSELSMYLMTLRVEKNIFKEDIKDVYNLFVPNEFKKNYIEKDTFYPKLTDDFLERILSDNDVWEKKKINLYYKEVIADLDAKKLPTYYEFLTILYLYKKLVSNQNYDDFLKVINTILGSDYMPLRFASGGKSDGVIILNGKKIIIEPTLVSGNEQMKFEIGIVKHLEKHNADYAILISPKFPRATIEIIEKIKVNTRLTKGWEIFPLENYKIKTIKRLDSLKDFLSENLDSVIEKMATA